MGAVWEMRSSNLHCTASGEPLSRTCTNDNKRTYTGLSTVKKLRCAQCISSSPPGEAAAKVASHLSKSGL
jgi:hypothetical protein